MSSALNRLAQRIHAVESEVRSFRAPQLAYSSVEMDDGTEMGVVEGFQTAVNADATATAASEAAAAAQDAADAAAAKALAVEAAAAQAQSDADAAASAATAAQSAADAAAADAAAVQTQVDGIPDQIATAKQEAITTSAGTAQQKADAAQQAAITAAAADADSKAAAAQSAATAAAATDAQAKADAAKAAAEAAAKTYSDTVSSGAKADAIAAAAADAKTKADAAEAAAKTAAAADAKAKADAAQAAAIAAAATDAQNKADLAKAAAINAAATDATSKANQAKTDAIAAAATDATTKAAQAKTDAINAAALTAQDKADLAQAAAIATAMGVDASNANPSFTNWTTAYPDGWSVWNGGAPTKETALARSVNAVRYSVTDAAASVGIVAFPTNAAMKPMPLNLDYVTMAVDVYLASGTFQGAGVLFDWQASGTYRVTTHFALDLPNAVTGKWYRLTKVMKRPAYAAAQTGYQAFLMANYPGGFSGAGAVKDIIFDRFAVRPSTVEEIAAYNAAPASSVTALGDAIASKGTDLVTNGTGLLGTNKNFSTYFDYSSDAPVGAAGSFVIKTGAAQSAVAEELIPYDPNKPYRFSFQIRQTVAGAVSKAYGFVAPYDAAGYAIDPGSYMYVAGTQTTLAADFKPGDTTIKLTSAAGWFGSAGKNAGTSSYFRSIQFWNYVDPFGKAWPAYSYTRNKLASDVYADGAVDTATNTITLRTAYAGTVTYPAGTPVSQPSAGGSYLYMPSLTNGTVPEAWTAYADTFPGGVFPAASQAVATTGGATWTSGVPSATAKIRIGWLLNYAPTSGKHAVAAVSFSDASAANYAANNITETQILPDAITAPKIKAGAIIAGKVAADAILAANIKAGEIAAGHLAANSVIAGKIAADAVTAGTIAAGAVIAGKIAANAVTATELAANAVTAGKIEAGAVIAGKLAADAVLANNIQAGAVVAGKLAADAVLATNVAADAILARNIKAGEITASHMAVGTITAASGVIGSLDAAKITVGKITAAQMATGTITAVSGVIGDIDASKITVGKITAAQMATGTITAASGVIGSIDAAKITVGKIAASQIDTTNLVVSGANVSGTVASATTATTATSATSATSASSATTVTGSIGTGVSLPGGQVSGAIPVASVPAIPGDKITSGTIPTTTTISGGSIKTGTIDASLVSVVNINAANITVGKISASQLAADAIDGKTISGVTITGGLFKTGNTGARWELGGTSYIQYLNAYSGLADETSPANLYANNTVGGITLQGSSFSNMAPAQVSVGRETGGPKDLSTVNVNADAFTVYANERVNLWAGPQYGLRVNGTTGVLVNGPMAVDTPITMAGEDWVTPSGLTGGWSNFGSGYEAFGYRKMADGSVRLRGLIKGGGSGTANAFFTLPVGYRPAAAQIMLGAASGGLADVRLFGNGTICVYGYFAGGTNGSVSLGMISFMPA